MLCYLWDTVKTLEAMRADQEAETSGERPGFQDVSAGDQLEKQLRRRVRVEMRRYFARRKRRNRSLLMGMLCVLLSVGWLFGYQIGVDRVSGTSMYPYLNHGDWIVYSRRGKGLKRDDVVVFEKNGESMVKRVAGLPGDRVEINRTGSCVMINGTQAKEEYVTLTMTEEEKRDNQFGAPQTVMDGQYLVLGDNRAESVDSRDSNVGTVSLEDVLGKVVWIIRDGR